MRELELMPLLSRSPAEWIDTVLADFDAFLLDHAACERKASSLAMSLVAKYPDRAQLLEPMICLAREELAHFHEVFLLIQKRGLLLSADEKDPYLAALLKDVSHGREEHFLDRLLLAAVVEARGCERFKLVADHLEDPELASFYQKLAKVEAGHYKIFINIAKHYFDEDLVEKRMAFWLEREAAAIAALPLRAAVH